MTGTEVKQLAKENGIFLWQIAEKLGINDGNFSRKLRKPLSNSDAAKVLNAVEQLKNEQA